MKQGICSPSSSRESGQPARRKGGGKQPPIAKFHKLGLSVREFVEAAVGPEGDGGSSGPLQEPACWNGRRNRRDMRREKRKLKRGRRKRLLIVNGEAKSPLSSRAAFVRKGSPPPPPVEEKEEKEEKEKNLPAPAELQPPARQPRTAPSAKAAAIRKRALLAANEAEEREIRRLERQLGLHKRRKKQRGGGGPEGEAAVASLPQSFSRDGLDYVLGALSEGALPGLYENGEENGEGEGSGTEEEEEEEGGLSPVEDGEVELGSSGDFSPEEGSDSQSEEGESSQEAAGLAKGFSVFKSADLNIAVAEKQNCPAWRRPEVKWYNGCLKPPPPAPHWQSRESV